MTKPLNSLAAKAIGKTSLRTVLVVPFVLQIVAAVGLVGYLSFKNGESAVNDLAAQLRKEISDRIEKRLNTYLAAPQTINQLNANAIDLGQLNLNDLRSMERHFWRQSQVFNSVNYIQFGSKAGELVGLAVSDKDTLTYQVTDFTNNLKTYAVDSRGNRSKLLNTLPDYDPRDRPWYTAAASANRPTWTKIYTWVNPPTLAITLGQPYYGETGNFQGILAVDFTIQQISDFLRTLKVGKSGKIFIVEPSGDLVASSAAEPPFTIGDKGPARLPAVKINDSLIQATAKYLNETFGSFAEININKQLSFELDGKLQFVQVKPFTDNFGLDWLIVVVVPESDFMEQIHANTRTTVWLCLGSLVLATLVGIFTARWIVQPILRLNTSAKAIPKGEWEQTVKIERSDELGELAKSFNIMAEELHKSFDNLETKNAQMKKLNQALFESERRLTQFLDAMPVGVFVVDIQGKPFYANSCAQQLLGQTLFPNVTADKLIENYQLYLAGSDRLYPQEIAPIKRALQGESVSIDDMEIRGDNIIPIQVWGKPICGETGEILYAIAAFADITERKRWEAALKQAEDKYRNIFENALEGIFQAAPDGRFLSANSALAHIYGYSSPSEFLANAVNIGEELYVDPHRRLEFLRLMQEHGRVTEFKSRVYRRDGTIIWISENARTVRDSSGTVYYQGFVEDITARQHAEVKRKWAEQLLEEYNQNLEQKVDERTRELSAALDHLKATQEGLIHSEKMAALGQLVAGVAHEINTPLGAIRSSVENLAEFFNGNLSQLPEFLQQLSPQRYSDFLALLSGSTQLNTILSNREKRQIKRALRGKLAGCGVENSEAIADTLADLGIYDNVEEFLPLLRDPNSSQILHQAYELVSLQKSTNTIIAATDRAAKVVFALKSYARYGDSGQKVLANITDGMETILTLYYNQIKHGVEVVRNYQAELPPVPCYPDELNQVWTNLIHNALQAMDNCGVLKVEARQENESVLVSVTDSGNGIPPEIMPRIFEPFFTTKPPGEGSGLGLDIVRKIVEKHSGRIKVKSVPGQTTFTVLIPIAT